MTGPRSASERERELTASPAPVVFLPGLVHLSREWLILRRHLERVGFANVSAVSEAPDREDLPQLAVHAGQHVEAVRSLTGAPRVHLVGHHVGGVVARYYVQVLGGHDRVATVVTVGSPHRGTEAAALGLGPATAQLRPGSAVLRALEETTRPLPVRWISYFAEDDLLVRPASSAMLTHPALAATNVLVTEHSHLSLVIPAVVCRSLAEQLAAIEGLPGAGSPLAPLPKAGSRLLERLQETGNVSPEAFERARALHPSSTPGPRRPFQAV